MGSNRFKLPLGRKKYACAPLATSISFNPWSRMQKNRGIEKTFGGCATEGKLQV
jgi:hypothetical protein